VGQRAMSDKYSLIVRVRVEGRASRRWRGAANQAEADKLNKALSEARAQNLRKPVIDILKKQLPGVTIEVPGIDGNMRLLKNWPFKCSACGSREVALWLFAQPSEADTLDRGLMAAIGTSDGGCRCPAEVALSRH